MMTRIVDCIVRQHDLALVLLAAVICVVGALTTILLVAHTRRRETKNRLGWTVAAGVACGFSIWATHFIAMLAYDAGFAVEYAPGLTVASLVVAIFGSAAAIGLLGVAAPPWRCALAGAGLGSVVAAMHFTGMSAMEAPGQLAWNTPLLILAIIAGPALGAVAMVVAARADSWRGRLAAAGWLAGAICAHHFLAMSAFTIAYDPTVELANAGLSADRLATGVATACLMLLSLTLVALEINRRDTRSQRRETARMRDLANATAEGLLILRMDGAIAEANQSVLNFFEATLSEVTGEAVGSLVQASDPTLLTSPRETPFEAYVRARGGELRPVECQCRTIVFDGEEHLALALRDLSELRRAERDYRFLAFHDPLTRLANRANFSQRLAHQYAASAPGATFAVLVLDVDRFKAINDTLGHAIGDRLLCEVAARLVANVRQEDLVARLGGDEFAILICGGDLPAGAGALAQRLVDAIREPYEVGGHTFNISTSIGVAVAPADGATPEELVKNADLAMYRAKSDGKGVFRFFEEEMDAAMQRRRLLELHLRMALANGEFSLAYQPLHDVAQGTISGFEALLRWVHPTRGPIPPSDFIPLAEETGMIGQIGEWVLRQACAEAATWPDGLTVAVNFSPAQFRSDAVVDAIKQALETSGLEPERLEVEITESVLLQDNDTTLDILHRIRAMGVKIAMDDFGTGYSSLSYLRSFPFDKLKIDRSFVSEISRDEDCSAIVAAIVNLSRSLRIPTTAEGVETADQMRRMSDHGCDQIQGFYISEPLSAAALRPYLARQAAA